MRKKGWLKYLSMLMTLALLTAMMPAGAVLAAEEGKIILTQFEELKKPETINFVQGTEEDDLKLPEEIQAYDEAGNEYTLTDLSWTIRPKKGDQENEEDTSVEPKKYDPLTTAPGTYVFTLKLDKEGSYEAAEGVKLPKTERIIDPVETEPETEAPTEGYTEPMTEAPTEAYTEPWSEEYMEPETTAPTEAYTEPMTEPWTEAYTEPMTEAPTEAYTEPMTEAPTEPATEPWSEESAEPVTEPAGGNYLGDVPMVSLVLPEKMEVGKSYQLQYDISNEELANLGEESVSYTVQEGAEYVDMPDQSGNFTVVGEGPVAFRVSVMLDNGTELQADAQSSTVPAEMTEAPETEDTEAPDTETPVTESETQAEAEPKWNENMTLMVTAPQAGNLSRGDYPLTYTLTNNADGSLVDPGVIPAGLSVVYEVSDPTVAEIVPAEDGSTVLRAKEAGTVTVKASIDGLVSDEVGYTVVKSSEAQMLGFAVGGLSAVPADGQILITLPCNSTLDLANIVPTITVSDRATVTPSSGTAVDFSDGTPKAFVVTAEDGVTANTYQVTVVRAAHSFGEWVVTKEATCTVDGHMTRTCSVCQATETQVIPATGHQVSAEWETTKKATCTEKGTQVKKCTVCGEVVKSRETKALGHKLKTVRTEPTCTEEGVEYKKCSRCDAEIEKKVLEALGHNWSEWKRTKEPTTSSKGMEEHYCIRENCGKVESREVQRLNIIGLASNNLIWGFSSTAKYPVNSVITFEAIGDGMDNSDPISGDVRYVPSSTWNLVNDYKWGDNGYSASFRITKAGNYTLRVVFQRQVHDGTNWVNTGETSTVEQSFIIAGEGQYTDENGNGTGNTKNPDQIIGGGVKTGDNTPIVALVVVLIVAALYLKYIHKFPYFNYLRLYSPICPCIRISSARSCGDGFICRSDFPVFSL